MTTRLRPDSFALYRQVSARLTRVISSRSISWNMRRLKRLLKGDRGLRCHDPEQVFMRVFVGRIAGAHGDKRAVVVISPEASFIAQTHPLHGKRSGTSADTRYATRL